MRPPRVPSRLAHALYPWRVLRAPAVVRLETLGPDRARVELRGVVCLLCAARAGAALATVDGVTAARVDLREGVAELALAPGRAPDRAALQAALDRVVLARGARRLFERALLALPAHPARRRRRAGAGIERA